MPGFFDVDKKVKRQPLQKIQEGEVVKKRAGRPAKPNMVRRTFKVDKGLLAQLNN